MNPVEANEIARWMHGLFPSLTPEQVIEWATEFERCEAADVRAAVSRHHRETPDGFVKPGGLSEGIRAEASRRRIVTSAERMRQAAAHAQDWQAVAAAVGAMDAGELDRRRDAALERLAPAIRKVVERKPLRESKLLMAMVYDDVQQNP